MITRYAVRRSDQGFGVWDAAVNGWHSARDLDEPSAADLADTMNARYTVSTASTASPGVASTDRPDSSSPNLRVVDPPRRVLISTGGKWWPGQLDRWSREPDGWYGRATLDAGGPSNWYPATALRPAAT